MSKPIRLRRAGIALAAGFMFAAMPAASQAAAVDLGTAGPFVVLGGSTVTNTGPSVLDGDLGLHGDRAGRLRPAGRRQRGHARKRPGRRDAQADLATACTVAAGQPVSPGNVLTGTDLGNRTLTAGNYQYATSAQLTDKLTLDAEGDPNAQFVFEIGSTLTTASANSVELIDGASPCNVYWQIGSSATLGSTTAFQGNLLALTSIALDNGASVIGRALARNGAVTLDDNVLDTSLQRSNERQADRRHAKRVGGPGWRIRDGHLPDSRRARQSERRRAGNGTVQGVLIRGTTRVARPVGGGTAILLRAPRSACTAGFHATMRGKLIKRVVFSLDGRRLANTARSRWPPAPARPCCRSWPAARARSRCTGPTAWRARRGPRPRTAASG